MIRTRIFEFFHELRDPVQRANPQLVQEHFQWYLDLWTRAEERGFHGIFFSEHHFGAAYSPSPNLLVAAMASRTTTMRLGTLGTVTPYATPWRVVEEFAMLDQLTNGRFDAGFVSGIPPELGAAGIDTATAARRHEEISDLLAKIVGGASAPSHSGTEWNFGELRILPPFAQARLPVWTACKSVGSASKAGTRGWNVCGGFLSTPHVATMFDAFRNAASDAGNPHGADQIGIRRLIRFVDSPADHASGVLASKESLLSLLNESVGPLPPFAAMLDRPEADGSGLSDDEFVTGTPTEVAEQIVEQCKAVGSSNMVVSFSPIAHDELQRHHELYAREVIPVLKKASVVAT
jgi:alkanesulfonate monooxygenase SsuD/methylene tetrahydromethanopterin reductase-like flavin-dependent oxidoreductase (luciferase family)